MGEQRPVTNGVAVIVHAMVAKAITINPTDLKAKILGIIFILISIGLAYISLMSIMENGRQGNTRGNWDVSMAVMVGLIPAAIGASGVGIAIMLGGLQWFGLA